ncbi:MAG: cyclic nucleotide-binding domain-containing protein [Proteobacteria bacterium]|nr:cyclic nucleotide-binding domain-containing protein [Pseudomonadota bacterium]
MTIYNKRRVTEKPVFLLLAAMHGFMFFCLLYSLNTSHIHSSDAYYPMPITLKHLRRQSDLPTEQEADRLAKSALRRKKTHKAAEIYLQAQMYRQAIDVLENAGHIQEAAHILTTINATDRAALLFERNKRFKEASEIYAGAKSFLKAAQAAKRGGCHAEAGDYFVKDGRFLAAGSSYLLAKDYFLAGRAFGNAKEFDRAISCYQKWIVYKTKELNRISNEDREHVAAWIKTRRHTSLAKIMLQNSAQMVDLIHHFTLKNDNQMLPLIIKDASDNDIRLVLKKLNFRHPTSATLAKIFYNLGHHENAGIIYEKLQQWEQAAEAFRLAKKFARALSLYCKIGNWEKAKLVKTQQEKALSSQSSPEQEGVAHKSKESNALINDFEESYTAAAAFLGTVKKPATQHQQEEEEEEEKEEATQAMSSPQTQPPPQKQTPKQDSSVSQVTASSAYERCSHKKPPKSFYCAAMLQDFMPSECEAFWQFGYYHALEPQDILLSRERSLKGCYIILSGTLCTPNKRLTFQKSDTIGEITLFSSHPLYLDVIAQTPSEVFYINQKQLMQFASAHGVMTLRIYQTYLYRLISDIQKSTVIHNKQQKPQQPQNQKAS